LSDQAQLFIAAAIFLITYAVIVSEKIHRTNAAIIGASLLVLSRILNVEDAIKYIDWNTIGLLTGMMIIVRGLLITFLQYMKVTFSTMLVSIVICSVYLLFWNLEHGFLLSFITIIIGLLLGLLIIPLNKMFNKSWDTQV